MRAAWLLLLPLLACVDESDRRGAGESKSSNGEDECEPNEDALAGAFNADSPWGVNSDCDEIYVCADATAAQTLSELGWQCQVHKGAGYCNGEGDVQCVVATDVLVTEQEIADACTALTVPGIVEVVCSKLCC